MKKSIFTAVLAAALLVATSAFAGEINGVVDPINSLTSETYLTDVTGATSLDAGATDVDVASGIIDNNWENGWNLTVTSANNGVLIRTTGAALDSYNNADQVAYSAFKFVSTGGTLGSGLTDLDGTTQSVTSGSCVFDSGSVAGATTATEDYGFKLQITVEADSSLLQGTYTDTLTMTLAANEDMI